MEILPPKMNNTLSSLFIKQLFVVSALVLFSFSAKAQITTTVSGGDASTSSSGNFGTACGTNSSGYSGGVPSGVNLNSSILITYSAPVNTVRIPFTAFGVGSGGQEIHRFDVLGQANEVLSFGCSGIRVSGNVATSTIQRGFGEVTISSSTSFTQIQITIIDNGGSSGGLILPGSDFFNANNLIISAACPSTPVIPTLSAVTLSNTCPATTADLTSITASNTPTNATLTWHASTPASNTTKITAIDALTAGTYYAAFYYSDADCYSDANGNGTTAVTVTINSCCNAGTTAPVIN